MTAISKTADAEEHHVAQHGRADFAPWWVYASYTLMYAAAIQLMPLIEVVSVISFNMVALGALYYGGWLLLLVCVPLAVMADKASQLLMLMSFKRWVGSYLVLVAWVVVQQATIQFEHLCLARVWK